jgi:hypothetical protein
MTGQSDNRQTERLLRILDNEINQKCLEIKEQRKNALLQKIFFGGCITAALIFGIITITGFQFIRAFVYLVLFQGLALLILIPVLLNMNGGCNDVQKIG